MVLSQQYVDQLRSLWDASLEEYVLGIRLPNTRKSQLRSFLADTFDDLLNSLKHSEEVGALLSDFEQCQQKVHQAKTRLETLKSQTPILVAKVLNARIAQDSSFPPETLPSTPVSFFSPPCDSGNQHPTFEMSEKVESAIESFRLDIRKIKETMQSNEKKLRDVQQVVSELIHIKSEAGIQLALSTVADQNNPNPIQTSLARTAR